jgi:hypothetical protein
VQDAADPLHFVVIDRWASRNAYERFRKEFASEYEELDQKCLSLTEEEISIGSFQDAET